MTSLSSVSVFDNHRFQSAFNEELYNTIVKNKKVIVEVCFDLMDDEYPEIREQIALRGWRRLAAPKPEISEELIHEFYANAFITEEEMEEHGGHSYKSFVRGVPINFSPDNIRRVMRFKAQVEGARTDFETRKEHDQQLDIVLADLCMPGATWKLSTGQQKVPIQLRRQELNPIARGWHELSIHSLIPSSNRSEIPMIRAILIHCIMNGEDVRAEEIIADKMQPPLHEIPTYTDQHEKDLHSIEEQLQNMMWLQQQCLENINKSQVEYMIELRAIKGKQQEMFEKNDRFYNQVREEQREMAKEIQQVKNYQVNQTMVESARNKALMEELAAVKARQDEFFSNQTNQYNMIRQEQNLLGKEILDVKKHQMNTVTMGSSSIPHKYEPDQALMKIKEQHANFSEVQRQLKEWTRNSSARQCYSVWAHQQANPNLVEMSVHKDTKQIYDNVNNNRPMFYGFLKSDLPPSETAPPPPKSKDPRHDPN
ncbi:hypothetical protein PIB30_106003 [Stylosanthes scabra]|uniref:Putative plant transposon protein domain-containing protein n=1 Tax=Stylosanthes scabra TaxID=79078 RepID=A0ABU6WX04_9FABA|nr:hypothetical protein [Stylosanthes scabra]